MKKHAILLGILFLCLSFWGTTSAQTIYPDAIDGKIYMKFKDDVNIQIPSKRDKVNFLQLEAFKGLINAYGITKVSKPFFTAKDSKLQRTLAVEFSNYGMVDMLIRDMESHSSVEYAERAPIFKLAHTPNDPNYTTTGNKWHLNKINASTAWDVSTGDPNVIVAVVDNAIWTDHPELINKVVAAIDLGDGDNITTPPAQTAEWSHGTHTSGLVGAHTNNGIGTASIGYNVSLMAVKVARDSDGALTAGFEGIVWAVDNGADVINMSWGSAQYFQTMQNIVDYAYGMGCVLVASAGNDGTSAVTYPAGLNHVISVGSTDGNNKKSSFSQFGSFVDVMAPGGYQNDGGILDILLNNSVYSLAYGTGTSGYTKMQGTSMSSPIVAGLCGLMLSVDTTLTPDRLETYLKASCTNIDGVNSSYVGQLGAGLVNAFAAVTMVQDSISPLVANFTANQTWIPEGGMVSFSDQSIGTPTGWQWTFTGGSPPTSNVQNPQGIQYSTAGTYPVSLTVTDGLLNSTETKNLFITVDASGSSAWFQQVSGFTTQYRGIDKMHIVSPQIVWGTAINGAATSQTDYYTLEFTRTNDGGQNWTPGIVTGVPATYVISSICATSYNKAWIACFNNVTTGTDKGGIYVTSNGGQSWTKQATAIYNDAAAFPNVVHFWNNNEGWAMGDPVGGYYEMYNTVDGGDTWVRTPQANIPAPLSGEYGYTGMYDVVGDTIWWGTNNGRVMMSTDKGYNWSVVSVSGITDIQDITFNNSTHGMLQQLSYNQTTGALEAFKVMKTSDGGLNWSPVDTTGMYKSDLDAVPGIPGMFVSVGAAQGASGSSYTVDSGTNWTELDVDIQYISVKFLDGNTGWAGSYNMSATMGGVYKWKGLMSVMVSNMPVCAGDTLDVNVNVIGALSSGNVFSIELSDASGSFTSPTVIGTVTSDVSSAVSCIIPLGIQAGTAYRLRAVSSSPVNTTADNGFNITINNKPLVNAGNNTTLCYSSAINLSGQVMYQDSVLWQTNGTGVFGNNGATQTIYTPTSADSTAGIIEFYLTAYSDCGFTKDTLIITLTTAASADAGANATICAGDSYNLTANGGNTYLWATDPSLSSINTASTIATPSVTTTYAVTVTSQCGTASDEVVLTVNPAPAALLSTNDPVTFCDGGQATLTINYDPTYSYAWYEDGNMIAGATDTLYDAETTGIYTVMVTNNSQCSQLSNALVVSVNPLPIGSITASDTTVFCEGDSITLNVNTSTNNSFSWTLNGSPLTGYNDMPVSVTASGVYSAILSDTVGCTSNTGSVDVTVNPLPATPTISLNGNILFSSALNGNQWYLDGNIIPGAIQRPYTPTVTGNYTVQVTSPEGCASDMSAPYYFPVGIEEAAQQLLLEIYPNPSNGFINIKNTQGNLQNIKLEIFDTPGQLVFEQELNSTGEHTINISHLTEGLYFIKITENNVSALGKLIIQY